MSDMIDTQQSATPATVAPDTAQSSAAPTEQAAPSANFLDSISEDLRVQSNIKDFKDINELAKSYVNLQRMVGNSVRIPPADASPEAKKEFLSKIKEIDGVALLDPEHRNELYAKLGRPEEATKYSIDDVIPAELMAQTPELHGALNSFKEVAFQAGVSNEQAAALTKWYVEDLQNLYQAREVQKATVIEDLRKDWGPEFDNKVKNVNNFLAQQAASLGDSVNELAAAAGTNKAFIKMMDELASIYAEKGQNTYLHTNVGLTPDTALAKIADKKADIGFMEAYHNDRHPGHQKAVEEMLALQKLSLGIF